jgi:cytochrome c2
MPRAGRSSVWWLWAVGLLAFLLTAASSKARAPTNISLASGSDEVADPGEAPHVRIDIVVAAAALCVLLAVAVVALLQVNQMREDRDVAQALTGGDPTKAAALATRFGCAGCHTIPGLPGAHGQVAAPLEDLRKRTYLAGVVRNTTDNLVQWIVDPPSLSPRTAMPVTGISRREAADLAAYLYAH